jgi:hypothetical protein
VRTFNTTGIGDGITPENVSAYASEGRYTMFETSDMGCWVLARDAKEQIQQAKQSEWESGLQMGIKKGRAEGQVKLDSYRQLIEANPLMVGSGDSTVEFKRTSQLLNELYHDRARLERVVKDAVSLMETIERFLERDSTSTPKWGSGEAMTTHQHEAWVTGLIDQFIDTHGEPDGA